MNKIIGSKLNNIPQQTLEFDNNKLVINNPSGSQMNNNKCEPSITNDSNFEYCGPAAFNNNDY